MKRDRTPSWLWRLLGIEFMWGCKLLRLYLGGWCEICYSKGERLTIDVGVGNRRLVGGFAHQYSFVDPARPRLWGITACKRDNAQSVWEGAWGWGKLGFRKAKETK